MRTLLAAAGFCAACAAPAFAEFVEPEDQTATSLMRIFTDSDHVAVRSWMADYAFSLRENSTLAVHWNNERVRIPGISAPAGTQEAIDAVTTASRPISGNAYQDFVKVRNEFQGEWSQGPAAVEYYHSSESDYLAQQLGARYQRDFMDEQFNVSMGTSFGWDAIDPLADDDTNTNRDTRRTLHWNAVATRILSPTRLVRLGLEYNLVEGLQHNPYRNVYAGGTNVPERHPSHRQRRDVFLKVNQYFENRSSLRFSYRFYNDDWGVDSHEADAKLSQYVCQGVFAQYQYRYYTQTSAYFYRDEYLTTNGVDGYRSGDYRMAELSSNLFGVTLNFDLSTLAADTPWVQHTGARLSWERYFNSNNYSANILETGLDFRF